MADVVQDSPPYREKALSHYGERCVVCGSERRIEVHHMDRDRSNNNLDNLVPLCSEHHHELHNRGHPYSVFIALADPILSVMDDIMYSRGYTSRTEVVSRALLAFVDTTDTDSDTHMLARQLVNTHYWEFAPDGDRLDTKDGD